MAFIDWNNNGEIDSEDIAIGVALIDSEEDEKRTPYKSKNVNPGCGCLSGVFLLAIIIVVVVGSLLIISI